MCGCMRVRLHTSLAIRANALNGRVTNHKYMHDYLKALCLSQSLALSLSLSFSFFLFHSVCVCVRQHLKANYTANVRKV